MGFSIFAAGTNNFHYAKDDCLDDSDFKVVEVLGKLQAMEPTKMGAVATGIDIAQPSAGIIDAMQAMATMQFLHLLNNAVSFLAMKPKAREGWIFVSARESHLLWPDTGDNGEYKFYPGDNPGHEFMKKIGPALKAADMANWGVLRELVICLSKFERKVGNAVPAITIQLSH
ncbi:MAG TPA: hypothetical protein DEP46_09490 [Blastocatellia bacterium]|nr:hypothetical protein [Blastocatellia bacterium]